MFSLEGIQPNVTYWIWVALAMLMSVRAGRTYGWIAGTTLAWISFSAFRLFAAPTSPYVGEEEIWNASLSLSAASAWIGVVLACSMVQMFQIRSWVSFWQFTALGNAAMIIVGTFLGQPCGILGNASMSGSMQAVLFPLFFDQKGKVPIMSAIMIPASILITCKNQPIALFFLSIGVVLIRHRAFKELIIAVCASLITGVFLVGHMLGNSEGRTDIWKLAYDFWCDHANPILGMGLGTFYYIGPWMSLKPFGQGFLTLHSDWLQLLFECGSIGFALMLTLFIEAVIRARRHTVLCTSLIVYGAWALANFPLHNPISALLGVFLMAWALEKAPKEKRIRRSNCPA